MKQKLLKLDKLYAVDSDGNLVILEVKNNVIVSKYIDEDNIHDPLYNYQLPSGLSIKDDYELIIEGNLSKFSVIENKGKLIDETMAKIVNDEIDKLKAVTKFIGEKNE